MAKGKCRRYLAGYVKRDSEYAKAIKEMMRDILGRRFRTRAWVDARWMMTYALSKNEERRR